ncbi:bifunctional DNA primase/polymerase [Pseudomonas chlororaphis]|uniref:Bifunctional DNA primase/polymerase n=1 Tax=Pseudomonas chlororaphis TaxID=587753 RepID=A0AAX3G1A7_9PSED|nr:bifunctional DNA primase/polymerase [Pseudomonas chlororaphis]AZC35895.1 DNA primase/helicase, phage-associated [Pseudomonas chlororaphis subsp. piscium]AZC42440.1 DNA primase/helicase, phage-associated [Pseudomonas chlororaphis subsp. piscium]WDG74362.1 bifunctional DNA primase/polymerase [Pseudomonas chlororaphis]WDH28001.1 bifunctional DNA primase/polymerase [Pseudomonas chlororaphis]WDH72883.1 bifunctional DNA primase/polymerase [Pseudomonas chlororaphis]
MTERPTPTTADWARRYIETFGLALVPIEPGEKGPKGNGWNKPGGYFTDASTAEAFWNASPSHNLGVVLGPSRVCSLDVDDVEFTRQVLQQTLGLDVSAIAAAYPTSVGNPARFRVMFRVPDGVELSRHSLVWPNKNDPDGTIYKGLIAQVKAAIDEGDAAREAAFRMAAEPFKKVTVFELRGGLVQDVLPPSIHPGTRKPYTWRTPPAADGLPELPAELLAIWQGWDEFKPKAEAVCPWKPKPVMTPTRPAAKPSPAAARSGDRLPEVIPEFNRCHDIATMIEAHGYKRMDGKWLCPQSSSGEPGVTINDDKLYSHHTSDPLANGHKNDAFDVFCILEHGGDVRSATKEAARLLGLGGQSRPPSPAPLGEARSVPDDLPRAPSGEQVLAGVESLPATAAPDYEPPPGAPSPEWPEDAYQPGSHIPGGSGGFRISEQELLRDFVVIYGSDVAWDCARGRMIKLPAIREAVGRTTYKWWQESEHRRMAQDVVFDPTETCNPMMLNLFDGFHAERDERGKDGCQLILKHLGLLCNNRADEYRFLLKWIAYPLQNPGAKMATAVVMFGAEGPGKSLLWEKVVREIYGAYGTTIGQAQLESQFTGWQSRKLFALAEEVVSREEMRHYKGVLKHLVTGETLQINEKNMPVREERNHLNFVFLSNSTVPLALDDGDRRYLVLYVDRVPPKEYFEALVNEIESGGIAAFYEYLMGLDLTGFSPHTKPPLNEEKQGLIDGSLPAPRYFVRRWLAGETEFPVTAAVTQDDLWRAFCKWCDGANEFKRRQRDFTQEAVRDLKQARTDIRYPTKGDQFITKRIYVTPSFLAEKGELGRDWAGKAGLECRKFTTAFDRHVLPPPGPF